MRDAVSSWLAWRELAPGATPASRLRERRTRAERSDNSTQERQATVNSELSQQVISG